MSFYDRKLAVLLLALGGLCNGVKAADLDHSFLLTKEEISLRAPKNITKAQAAQDSGQLEKILRGGYSAWAVLKKRDANAEKVFKDMQGRVQALPDPVDTTLLLHTLKEALTPFRDTHLSLAILREDGTKLSEHPTVHSAAYTFSPPAEAGWTLTECNGAPYSALRSSFVEQEKNSVKTAARPVLLSTVPVKEIVCTVRKSGLKKTVPVSVRRLKYDDPAPAMFSLANEEIPVLRLGTLDLGRPDILEKYVRSASVLKDSRSFVLDIRGNSGGSSVPVDNWLETLSSRDGLNPGKQNIYGQFLLSRASLEGQLNAFVEFKEDDVRSSQIDSYLRSKLLELDNKPDKKPMFLPTEEIFGPLIKEMQISSEKGVRPFRGYVVILADSGCASSCEDLIANLKDRLKTPVIVVGENTGGFVTYGDIGLFVLPNSRIRMRLASTYFAERQGFEEGQGFLPDFWIDTADPLPTAKAVAECMRDKKCRNDLLEKRL